MRAGSRARPIWASPGGKEPARNRASAAITAPPVKPKASAERASRGGAAGALPSAAMAMATGRRRSPGGTGEGAGKAHGILGAILGPGGGGVQPYPSQARQSPAAWNMIPSAISNSPMPRLSRMAKTMGS